MDDWYKDLWQAVSSASPIGAMLCMLFLWMAVREKNAEKAERIAIQKSERDLHERTLNAINSATVAIDRLTVVVETSSAALQSVRISRREE